MSAETAGRSVTLLLLFWLVGVGLRITVLAVPPVVPLLHADLHLTEAGIGWLSSLPPMLFAIAAVPGALLIARFGMVPALLTGLLLGAAGSAARGMFVSTASLFVTTIAMGAGISIVQTVMPPLVRVWFPQRIGLATSVYINGLLLGEIIPVGLTIPFVLPLVHQSWRLDFVVWSVPVLATALLFVLCRPRRDAAGPPTVVPQRRWWPDWRDPLIWRLGLILGSVNATYFVTNAFLPDLLAAGRRPDLVSSALISINVGQLPGSLLMLPLAERLVKRPWAYAATGLLSTSSVIAMLLTRGDWIVFWAGVLGFTGAVTLTMALALPSILSPADDVHRTTAGMFTISYSCAMVLSVVVGWLWDVTHRPLVGLAPIALGGLVIVALASTVRQVDRNSAATV
ncbi:MAG: MFS transporter [Xanthobacteraceae bacterium]